MQDMDCDRIRFRSWDGSVDRTVASKAKRSSSVTNAHATGDYATTYMPYCARASDLPANVQSMIHADEAL